MKIKVIITLKNLGGKTAILKSAILTIPKDKRIKKPTEGIYNQCSAITAFKGIILDTGIKFKKNQQEEKKTTLEYL